MATTSNNLEINSNILEIFSNNLEINSNILETFSNNLEINGNNGNNGNLEKKNVKQKNICEFCNKQYNNYSGLWKHKKKCKEYSCIPISTDESKIICEFCNKTYLDRSGLWRHKKTCKKNTHYGNNESDNQKEDVVMLLIKENAELKNMIIKVLENVTINNSNNNNSNNNINNKTFNLQFFLNETCKDAMNITEFIESLELQLSDLENIGTLGYVDGISKIIIKHLKALDETRRPIHCTDKKRETFYIKDDDKWEKEDENKTRIRKAINYVANENTLLIPQWKAKHPDYLDSSSGNSDQYNNMIIEVLGGENSNDVNENKIIKKIAKEIMIQKQ
jgi:hypothetical protein